MKIKIDKDIPIPMEDAGLPFNDMEIGDSFFVSDICKLKSARTIMSSFHAKTEKKFISRSVNGGFRFWRVS